MRTSSSDQGSLVVWSNRRTTLAVTAAILLLLAPTLALATMDRLMTYTGNAVAEAANGVQGIAFSPDQKFMAVMGSIGTSMQLFSKGAPTQKLPQLRTVADSSIAFLDDRRLVTFPSVDAPSDTLLEVVDADDLTQRTFVKGPRVGGSVVQNRASSFCLSYDRKTIVVLRSTGPERFIAILDGASLSARFADMTNVVSRADPFISVACSYDGAVAAFGSINGDVFLLETSTMKIRSSFTAFAPTLGVGVLKLAISPDGKFLAVGPTNRMTDGPIPDFKDPRNGLGVKLWHLPGSVFAYTDGGTGAVREFSWSPASGELAIARDDVVSLLDVDGGKVAAKIKTHGTATVVFHPNGNCFAFGDRNTVRLSKSSS